MLGFIEPPPPLPPLVNPTTPAKSRGGGPSSRPGCSDSSINSCDPTEDGENGAAAGQLLPEDDDDDQKPKKIRTTFTGRQIFELETMFEHKKYLSSSERLDLSQKLSVTEQQVHMSDCKIQYLHKREFFCHKSFRQKLKAPLLLDLIQVSYNN